MADGGSRPPGRGVTYILSFLLLLLAFLVFTENPRIIEKYTLLKACAGVLFGSLVEATHKPVEAGSSLLTPWILIGGAKRDNTALREKLRNAESENLRLEALREENRRLTSALKLEKQEPVVMAEASVIGRDSGSWFKCIIIDRGSIHGVKRNMTVTSGSGLIGRVTEVSRGHSKVMTVYDVNSFVDVYVEGKDIRAVLKGTGRARLEVTDISSLSRKIIQGDRLVTSGKDFYPKGIPVAIVSSVTDSEAKPLKIEATLFAAYGVTDRLIVEKKR